ncbi:hypothetical protein MPH47_17160 [Psychrobacillus psychrodurans]|uniref:hypothetical protein n=1 Tax=Psychrobacillus psychrodurans TaxID=126157 RepID=UPI001F4E24DE|nr:hypothetical protein [Psychrobacillus psychrodurans]MCK1998928.1 hypothetical protein [Psychrobacillus psychrodurans]
MKRVLYIFAMLIVGIYFIFGLVNTISRFNEVTTTDITVMLITLVIVALVEIYLFKRYKKSFNAERTEERKKQETIAKQQKFDRESLISGTKERKQLLGADFCIKVKHMAGLPVAEGAEVFVYRCKDKVIFERNQENFELDVSNMKDILIKTETEIQKSYASSVGGAVGGYVLFGPLGAMVGGRTKEKTSTITDKYLIFDYVNKNGTQEFISFEVTKEPDAILFNTNHYQITKQERTTVSL